jgi:hypothetical protein
MNNFFEQFKNKHKGETAVLFAPGNTLKDFNDIYGPDVKRVGVSGTILHDEIAHSLNYYVWSGDIDTKLSPRPVAPYIMDKIPHLDPHIIKFTNTHINGRDIHPGVVGKTQIDIEWARKNGFYCYNTRTGNNWITDITIGGLDANNVAFAAMQILLFMGFSKIILVGCDCVGDHSYKNVVKGDVSAWNDSCNRLVQDWKKFYQYIRDNYPAVKVVVVNPIGLRGVIPEFHE